MPASNTAGLERLIGLHVRLVAQRPIGHAQHALRAGNWKSNVRSHPREKFGVRIIKIDHRVIGDDVLHRGRVHTDLRNLTGEGIFGISVHLETYDLAGTDHAHIRFVSAGIDLHLGQILRDSEQSRGLQRSSHGLPDIYAARDHSSIDRRVDAGVVKIGLRYRHSCLFLLDLRRCLGYQSLSP